MWAILGDIEFTVAGGITGIEHTGSADWAEHARIQAKPLLEWIGEGLDDCNLTLELHPSLGDPEQRLRALRLAKSQHEPLAFVMGSGEYLGAYVITHLSNSIRRTTAVGQPQVATVQISLREYTGVFVRKTLRPGLLDPTVSGAAIGSPGLISRVPVIPSATQQLIRHARTAGNVLRAGQQLYNATKEADAPTVLARVPQLLGATARAIEPLQGLTHTAGLLRDGADLAQLGEGVLASVQGARANPHPVDLANIADRLQASHAALDQALSILDRANPRLAALAADVLTRKA